MEPLYSAVEQLKYMYIINRRFSFENNVMNANNLWGTHLQGWHNQAQLWRQLVHNLTYRLGL